MKDKIHSASLCMRLGLNVDNSWFHINSSGVAQDRSLQEVNISDVKLWMIFLSCVSGPWAGTLGRHQAVRVCPLEGSVHKQRMSTLHICDTAWFHHLVSGLHFEMCLALFLLGQKAMKNAVVLKLSEHLKNISSVWLQVLFFPIL